jgi:hypothetical protein
MSTTATVSGRVLPPTQDTTAALRAALTPDASGITPGRRVYFLYLDLLPHPVRAHSDLGERSYNGELWQGVGTMGSLGDVESTTDLRSPAISAKLNLVNDEALRATLMLGGYQGRTAEIHLGAIDRNTGTLIAAHLHWSGFIDRASITTDGVNDVAEVRLTDEMTAWNTPIGGTYSHVDQVARYPADRGLEHVLKIQNTPVQWGQA